MVMGQGRLKMNGVNKAVGMGFQMESHQQNSQEYLEPIITYLL